MKPIRITPNYWPNAAAQNNSPTSGFSTASGTAGSASPPIKRWSALATLPANFFGQLIELAIAQLAIAKKWMRQPAYFLPGLLLGICLFLVILLSILLWPYGLFQQTAQGLWLYLQILQQAYKASARPSEKAAIALSMGVIAVVTLVFGAIALPIFGLRWYLNWMGQKPVIHAGITLLAVLTLLVLKWFLVPILIVAAVLAFVLWYPESK